MSRQHLTDFELMILLAILRIGDDAYGVPIATEIEQTAKRSVLLGAIYTCLDRLESNGLVTSTYGDPTPERGGSSRRSGTGSPNSKEAQHDFAYPSETRQRLAAAHRR